MGCLKRYRRILKKIIFLSVLFSFKFFALSQELAVPKTHTGNYRINEVNFISKGKTDVNILKTKMMPIDKERIFTSETEVQNYLASIYQQLENTRLLENILYSYDFVEESESDITLVNAEYSFEDSTSMIVFPAPSFDSNSGVQLKIIFNDDNFLGKTNPFTLAVLGQLGTEEEPDNMAKVTLGGSLKYVFPFNIGKTRERWINNLDLAWTIGEDTPVFNLSTGLSCEIPVGKTYLNITAIQSAINNPDFDKYDDNLYFQEKGIISLPLTLGVIDNKSPVVYMPYISASYNWDRNGINEQNMRLKSTPKLTLGQTTSVYHVDWMGNFRSGYFFKTTQSITRNFDTKDLENCFIPTLSFDLKLYKSFKYLGLTTNINYFNIINCDESSLRNIGYSLRGALDKQFFKDCHLDDYDYALETPAALIANFEIPVHVLTTHWNKWFNKDKNGSKFGKFLSYIDFEIQLAPFVDVALMKNRATGHSYKPSEGIYCAGIEMLVFPEHWKSYVLRISAGMDIGKKYFSDRLDNSWRTPKHNYEFCIAFGNHF